MFPTMGKLSSCKPYLPKLVAVIGGFLILMGTILLGVAALSLSGYLDIGLMLEQKYLTLFALTIVCIGLFDTIAAIIMARW